MRAADLTTQNRRVRPARLRGAPALLIAIVAALLGGLAPAARAQSQQTAVTISVRAGYAGSYRSGEWFPVTVDIANDGPDLHGELEWVFPGQRNEPSFRHLIDLPRGSRKRAIMSVFSRGFARSGQVRFLVGDAVVVNQNVSLEPIDADRFLIGVLSSDLTLLNSLESLSFGGPNSATVRHMQPEELPEQAAALRGLNALFLHDIDTAALSPGQRAALGLWAELGGQLVVSGGIGGQKTAAGLGDLLPVDVGGGVLQGDLAALGAAVGQELPQQNVALSEAAPRPGAEDVSDGAQLLYRWPYGVGAVAFSVFDFAALRGWAGELDLWSEVIAPLPLFVPSAGARMNQTSLLQNVLQIPSLGLPSATTLLLFLLGYVLVLGPLNYAVLRRIGRLEWAWVSVPLIVLVFAGGLYFVGFGLRGNQSQLNQITVVQATEGQPRGLATAFVGLFSPRRASYTIGFPADTLLSETRGWEELTGRTTPVINTGSSAELRDLLVDVASVRTLVAETAVDVPLSIQSTLSDDGNGVRGEIRNSGGGTLSNVLIVSGSSFQDLGTLAPGAARPVDLSSAQRSFPWGVNLPEEGLFNRKLLINSLFSGDSTVAVAGGTSGDSGVYLIAWDDQPSVPVLLDGRPQQQAGLTLYVVRLRA